MNWEMHHDSLKVDQNIQTRMQGWDKDANVGIEIRVSPKAMLERFNAANDQARRDAFLANLDAIQQVAQKRYNAPGSKLAVWRPSIQSDEPIIIQLDNDDFESVS